MRPTPPVMLIVSGNDPSGGAGIVADVQTATALGVHPAPVVTAITVQDTRDAYAVRCIDAGLVGAQARAVLEDMPVRAIKLGLLGSAAIATALADLLEGHRDLPVVIDPVLAAAGGTVLTDDGLLDVYLARLLPLAALTTPNALEGRRLVPEAADSNGRADALFARGVRAVLFKGGDEATPDVCNELFVAGQETKRWRWPRLPGRFHGSGCTLASAITARLAHGDPLLEAVEAGQRFAQRALERSWRLGRGQRIPDRRG